MGQSITVISPDVIRELQQQIANNQTQAIGPNDGQPDDRGGDQRQPEVVLAWAGCVTSHGSDEATIFAGKFAIRVKLVSLISQPNGSVSHRADLSIAVIALQRIAEVSWLGVLAHGA